MAEHEWVARGRRGTARTSESVCGACGVGPSASVWRWLEREAGVPVVVIIRVSLRMAGWLPLVAGGLQALRVPVVLVHVALWRATLLYSRERVE